MIVYNRFYEFVQIQSALTFINLKERQLKLIEFFVGRINLKIKIFIKMEGHTIKHLNFGTILGKRFYNKLVGWPSLHVSLVRKHSLQIRP